MTGGWRPPGPWAVLAIGAGITALALPESWEGWPYAPFPMGHAVLAVVVPVAFGAWPAGRPWPEVRAELPRQVGPIAGAVGFAIVFVAGYATLLAAAGRTGSPEWNLILAYQDLGMLYEDRYGLALTVTMGYVLLGLWPMFGEELLYRGFLQRGLMGHTTAPVAALVTSVLFGLRHSAQLVYLWPAYPAVAGVAYFVWSFGLSMVLCWVYARTRSLWTVMALHAVNVVLAPGVLVVLNT